MDRDAAISFFVWTARRVRRQFSGLELRITELLSPIGVSLETSSALHYRSPFQNQRFSILRRQASVTNAQSFTLYFNSKRGKMIHINWLPGNWLSLHYCETLRAAFINKVNFSFKTITQINNMMMLFLLSSWALLDWTSFVKLLTRSERVFGVIFCQVR